MANYVCMFYYDSLGITGSQQIVLYYICLKSQNPSQDPPMLKNATIFCFPQISHWISAESIQFSFEVWAEIVVCKNTFFFCIHLKLLELRYKWLKDPRAWWSGYLAYALHLLLLITVVGEKNHFKRSLKKSIVLVFLVFVARNKGFFEGRKLQQNY